MIFCNFVIGLTVNGPRPKIWASEPGLQQGPRARKDSLSIPAYLRGYGPSFLSFSLRLAVLASAGAVLFSAAGLWPRARAPVRNRAGFANDDFDRPARDFGPVPPRRLPVSRQRNPVTAPSGDAAAGRHVCGPAGIWWRGAGAAGRPGEYGLRVGPDGAPLTPAPGYSIQNPPTTGPLRHAAGHTLSYPQPAYPLPQPYAFGAPTPDYAPQPSPYGPQPYVPPGYAQPRYGAQPQHGAQPQMARRSMRSSRFPLCDAERALRRSRRRAYAPAPQASRPHSRLSRPPRNSRRSGAPATYACAVQCALCRRQHRAMARCCRATSPMWRASPRSKAATRWDRATRSVITVFSET